MTSDWSLVGDVSRETVARLQTYQDLLQKWSPRINLVAPATLTVAVERHFADSAQLLDFAPTDAESWTDIGSGGGFPGLVVAMLAAESRPGLVVTLIESDQRKCSFLRTVIRETGVTVQVVCARIETAAPQASRIVSARALAPLPRLLPLVQRHLAPDGIALLSKGQGYLAEIEQARRGMAFSLDIHPSRFDPQSAILSLGNIRNV